MSQDYLATFSLDPKVHSAVSASLSGLGMTRKSVDEHGTIFIDADAPHLALPDQRGFVLGHLFTAGDHPRRVESHQFAGEPMGRSGSEFLLRNYWGGYVAVLRDATGGQLEVLRDPSGTQPCYYVTFGAGVAVSSSVPLLLKAGFAAPEIDWTNLGQRLAGNPAETGETSLKGVYELAPGMGLIINGASVRTEVRWSPWDYVKSDKSLDDDQISERIHSVVSGCVAAWASCFNRVLLSVSGGLDSSVVAASLAAQTTAFECLTLATNSSEGDERQFARILTTALNVKLHEAFYQLDHVSIDRSQASDIPVPIGGIIEQSFQSTQCQIARQGDFDAFFFGVGGDNVFCLMQSATPLVDRLLAHGLRPGLWETLDDICRLTGANIWAVLKMAVAKLSDRTAMPASGLENRFLKLEHLRATASLHPWLAAAPADALPGKRVHVLMLTRALAALYVMPRGDAPMTIYPLMSQPIVELCLSIPTWKWLRGGRDRSIVRTAFANAVPAELLARRHKGGPDSFTHEVIEKNRQDILLRLMSGNLNSNGLLDTTALTETLDTNRPITPPDHIRLARIVDAEAWSRAWIRAAEGHRPDPPVSTQRLAVPAKRTSGRTDLDRPDLYP